MLSYRHAFHAGNHADMLKHFTLWLVLTYFNRKDKPYWYIDTHSGAGCYRLDGSYAQKVGEYRDGIGRLREAEKLPEMLERFNACLKNILPQENLYCGSPLLAASVSRPTDKLRLFELHPADFSLLQENIIQGQLKKRCIAKQADGYQGLIALLPPQTRRAVVLIDPPYEQKQDYERVASTLKAAQKRFAEGCYLVWYPCLSRGESRKLPETLKKIFAGNYLNAQLHVRTPSADGFGMHGSGIFVGNPPYTLTGELKESLPRLSELLAQDTGARFELDCQIK